MPKKGLAHHDEQHTKIKPAEMPPVATTIKRPHVKQDLPPQQHAKAHGTAQNNLSKKVHSNSQYIMQTKQHGKHGHVQAKLQVDSDSDDSSYDSSDESINSSLETDESSIASGASKERVAVGNTGELASEHIKELPIEYERSFLKIYNSGQSADYSHPWRGVEPTKWHGSGFVLEYSGRKFILTNAHVGESSVFLQVRFADDGKRYTAQVVTIEHDCDLAYLEITQDAEEFWLKARCLQMGEMFKIGQTVNVCGFPMGGEELCVTNGRVSRIEVDTYVHGDTELLQGQVSAAINPGNSGGAVISNKQVIGVAFQGSSAGEGLGYIIPPAVITHFLDDVITGGYKGFPALDFAWQSLENKTARLHNGMAETDSGIRVTKIDLFSSARKCLKPGDVITKINGIAIKNDGTIDTPFSRRINFSYLVSSRHIGEQVQLEIIRAGQRLTTPLTLLNRAKATKLIPPEEHGVQPTYYIASGLVFMPVTKNLIDDGDFDEDGIEDEPKRQLGQQLVIVNNILASELVEGYDGLANKKVKAINGRRILNILDVVYAIEQNAAPVHTIEVDDALQICVKNLSAAEHKKLLRKFHIERDRSADLKGEVLALRAEHGVRHECGFPEDWLATCAVRMSEQEFAGRLPSPERARSPIPVMPEGERASYLGFSAMFGGRGEQRQLLQAGFRKESEADANSAEIRKAKRCREAEIVEVVSTSAQHSCAGSVLPQGGAVPVLPVNVEEHMARRRKERKKQPHVHRL